MKRRRRHRPAVLPTKRVRAIPALNIPNPRRAIRTPSTQQRPGGIDGHVQHRRALVRIPRLASLQRNAAAAARRRARRRRLHDVVPHHPSVPTRTKNLTRLGIHRDRRHRFPIPVVPRQFLRRRGVAFAFSHCVVIIIMMFHRRPRAYERHSTLTRRARIHHIIHRRRRRRRRRLYRRLPSFLLLLRITILLLPCGCCALNLSSRKTFPRRARHAHRRPSSDVKRSEFRFFPVRRSLSSSDRRRRRRRHVRRDGR